MTDSSSTVISKIGKSRQILLELLENRGFDITNFMNFSNNEINKLFNNNQLDMLLSSNNKKVKVIYHLNKLLRPATVLEYVEEYFNLENTLTDNDDLIIIQYPDPNDSLIQCITNLYNQKGIYVIIYSLDRLQFNLLNHSLVPPHRILTDKEKINIENKYNITKNKEYPEISRFDPVSMAIGLRPKQVCEILRDSVTTLDSKYYRICL
jgi:DNA-directed RNA polymerase subunit H (RpoH/RPB5)